MKNLPVFILCLLLVHSLSAQPFGGSPSSIHWKQINTDTVRIIFPDGFEAKANRIASVVHYLQRNYAASIGQRLRKVNIVIQDQTLVSNGYVGLAPYRSEFYTTPPQNVFELGSVEWTDNLAVHEFRHVEQYSNFNTGLSHAATFILGEQGQAIANAASIPDWFFEGDAVFNETKLSRQGRGTLPFFMGGYQSLFNAGKFYSYEKMRNGSLRQYVPDHYSLGYLLVAYGRKKYGDDIWRKITADAAAFKPLLYPFQGAVKKYTGISFPTFVDDAMHDYQLQWKQHASGHVNWLTGVSANNVINYKYPYRTEDGGLIVLKDSYRKIPAFYRIGSNGKEEKIAVRDIAVDDYFSYRNNRIVYASFQPDIRWGNRDYNTIRVLNVQTGAISKIGLRGKYFSPDISYDGSRIIAVALEPSSLPQVVLLDTTGKVLDTFSQKELVFSCPKFAAGDQYYYVAARNKAGEMCLLKNGTNGKASETILPFSNRIIGFINVQSDTLLFSTTGQGRDEIWAMIDGKERRGPFRLAAYTTGLYQGVLGNDHQLIASAFTADGYRIGSFAVNWEVVTNTNELHPLYTDSVFRDQDHEMLNLVQEQQYPVNKYPKSFHLLNIHSFRPYYEQPEYSLTLYGQNILNTMQTQIAYTYNQNEGSHKLGYDGIFGGSFLQPIFGIAETWQRTGLLKIDTVLTNNQVHWNELNAYAGLRLPLNLSGGKQYRYLNLSTTYNAEQVKWTGAAEKLFAGQQFSYLNSSISYSAQIQKSVQQIYPHWAQTLLLQYRNIITNYTAHQLLLSGALYLPALETTHSIVLTAAFQQRDTARQYLFSNNFPFSRGYTVFDFPSMWKMGFNYHLPLAYPDKGLGNIVYFQRIRTNLFYDYTVGKSLQTGSQYPFNTVGAELYFDTKWWNQQPVSFGFRYSHLLNNTLGAGANPNTWELILPVNLFN